MAGLTSIILISGALLAGDGTKPFERLQPSVVRGPHIHGPHQLRPVDQAVGDVSPLSISLRQVDFDLGMPVDFERVYRLPGDDDRLVRAQGALYAVFPQSVYAPTEHGELPLIPADTVFYIGAPPIKPQEPGAYRPAFQQHSLMTGAHRSDLMVSPLVRQWKVDTRVTPRWADAASGTRADASAERTSRSRPNRAAAFRQQQFTPRAPEPIGAPDTITGDASYRADRLSALLQRAAEAAEARDQPDDSGQ